MDSHNQSPWMAPQQALKDFLVFDRAIGAAENKTARSSGLDQAHDRRAFDAQLVSRIRGGDERAEIELINRYQQKAFAIAFNMCAGDSHKAQDLVQESFLKVFRSLHRFDGRSSFYTWFYRIVVNTCIDHRRRRRLKDKVFAFWKNRREDPDQSIPQSLENQPDPDMRDHPADILQQKELRAAINQMMETLPEKQRIVFQLKVLDGLRIREIANILEMAEGTVKSHLFRAMKTARTALQGWQRV